MQIIEIVTLNKKLLRIISLFVIICFYSRIIYCREIKVFGKVENQEDQDIPGAFIKFISQEDGKSDSTYSDENGDYSIYLEVGETGIDGEHNIPEEFKLYQNYPNPFNPGTIIEFEIPKAEHVRLAIFNLLGQVVATIADGYYPSGLSSVYWDGFDDRGIGTSAGMYFYRIEAGSFVDNKKMLLLDGGDRVTTGNTARLLQKPLSKTDKALVQETFTIHAEKDGYDLYVEENFIVNSADDVIEKNIVLINSESDKNYFPIQLGNSWTFDLEYYDYDTCEHRDVTYTITGQKTIGGKEFYTFDEWPYFIYYPLVYFVNMDSVFIRNDENGDVVLRVNSDEFLFVKFDPALKDSMMHHPNIRDLTYWVTQIYLTDLVIEDLIRGYGISFFSGPGSQTYVNFFPGYGMVYMYYPAYSLTFKLKSAIINGCKLNGII